MMVDERRQFLRQNWGFDCTYPRCLADIALATCREKGTTDSTTLGTEARHE
jgi:hypothetical protein